jgi:hypothetical protein
LNFRNGQSHFAPIVSFQAVKLIGGNVAVDHKKTLSRILVLLRAARSRSRSVGSLNENIVFDQISVEIESERDCLRHGGPRLGWIGAKKLV